MKNLIFTFLFFVICGISFSQTTYYVSNSGYDYPPLLGDGSSAKPYKTLKRAYDRIVSNGNAGSVTYNIVLKNAGGEIAIASGGSSGFVWGSSASGTASHPINIYSDGCQTTVYRTNDNLAYMIKLQNANYINFARIHFKNISQGALFLDSADYCKIEFCRFTGVDRVAGTSHGVIWVGVNAVSTSEMSTGNKISDNIIEDIFLNEGGDKELFQAIYIGSHSENNEITNNTIFDPPSFGIHFWHEDLLDNQASYNIMTQSLVEGEGNNAFALGCETSETISTIQGNFITSNYVYDGTNSVPVYLSTGLNSSNDPHDSGEQNLNYTSSTLYPNDPYWLGYTASQITDRVVTGDFDNNGSNNDIASIYDNGNGTINIHIWTTESTSDKSFYYRGGSGWYSGTYDASKITGRVVAGDFDRDGYEDDIAALYNVGTNQARMDVWIGSGSSFASPANWWSVSSGFDVTKTTGRLVSGDMDEDGKNDDIAAFYYNSSTSATLYVWKSNGTTSSSTAFNDPTSWNSPAMDVTKITGRVVRGDFNEDTYDGDIAALFDNGGSATIAYVWITNGSSFANAASWWSIGSGYTAANTTGRVVAGDFDRDGKYSDVAAFYNNGGSSTNLHVWTSGSSSFTYSGDSGWWGVASGYDATKFTGRVVSADFDNDGTQDDISVFYDYTTCGNLRTNVWQSSGSSFSYINNSMGYPWWSTSTYRTQENNEEGQENEETILFSNKKENLLNAFPIPFTLSTTISFQLEGTSIVNLSIYAVTGQKIITLENSEKQEGKFSYEWNVNNTENGSKALPGIYICVLKTNEGTFTRKLIVSEK